MRDEIVVPSPAQSAELKSPFCKNAVTVSPLQQVTLSDPFAQEPQAGGLAKSAQSPAGPARKAKKPARAKKLDVGNALANVLLAAMVAMLLASIVGNAASGVPRVFAGWSASTVLTRSMQEVYPQGSLIVTHEVDPHELSVGDDITFMLTDDSSVTHRIVEIIPDLRGANEIAFKTKGTSNSYPDSNPCLGSNVVGKVVFCSPFLGAAVAFLKDYFAIPLFLAILALATKAALGRINRGANDNGKESKILRGGGAVASSRAKAGGRPQGGRQDPEGLTRPEAPSVRSRKASASGKPRNPHAARARDGTGGGKGGAGAAA